jgi:hypothetical protein
VSYFDAVKYAVSQADAARKDMEDKIFRQIAQASSLEEAEGLKKRFEREMRIFKEGGFFRYANNRSVVSSDPLGDYNWLSDQPKPEEKPKVRDEAVTKSAFAALLAGSGMKKTLPIVDIIKHKLEQGEAEDYKKKQGRKLKRKKLAPEQEPPKVLCGVCGDPMCPWSG